MLLIQLKSKEKFAFLRLAHFLAKTDGSYSDLEKELIDEYCFEMGIDNVDFEDTSLESILGEFQTDKSKRIALMELMILVHIDDMFNQEEYKIIQEICKNFNIDQKEFSYLSSWGKAVCAMREQAIALSLN